MTVTPTETHAQHAAPHDAAGPASGRRPRWLVPALAIGGAVAAMALLTGLVSPAVLVYGAVIAGCGLMHLVGHGAHGGHGDHR